MPQDANKEVKGPSGLQPGDGKDFVRGKKIACDLEDRCELGEVAKSPNKPQTNSKQK